MFFVFSIHKFALENKTKLQSIFHRDINLVMWTGDHTLTIFPPKGTWFQSWAIHYFFPNHNIFTLSTFSRPFHGFTIICLSPLKPFKRISWYSVTNYVWTLLILSIVIYSQHRLSVFIRAVYSDVSCNIIVSAICNVPIKQTHFSRRILTGHIHKYSLKTLEVKFIVYVHIWTKHYHACKSGMIT